MKSKISIVCKLDTDIFPTNEVYQNNELIRHKVYFTKLGARIGYVLLVMRYMRVFNKARSLGFKFKAGEDK